MTAPAGKRHPLRINVASEKRLREGSPWVYHDGITEGGESAVSGDLGVVFDRKGRFLAAGLLDPDSPIRLRVLQAIKPETIDEAWYFRRFSEAVALRGPLRERARKTNGFRLVNGESDHFPGLIADRYADTVVLKLYTTAWIPHLPIVLNALVTAFPHERTVLRLNRSCIRSKPLLKGYSDGQVLRGSPLSGPVIFQENGLSFEAEPIVGQKTGFFLDQRDNRARVGELSGGLDVLNVFSYTGGFSLYAARGGATSVASVDISRPATEAAIRNFTLNKSDRSVAACHHEPICQDAFQVLEGFARQGRSFDLVILDPPMFAQSSAQVDQALQAYARLTAAGLSVLRPGGILVQASCSNRVSATDFFRCIHHAATLAGRPLQEIERTGHGIDHPVTFSDGSYLKCLFARA
ncbi:MAG: class I SAM-dependent methyltransferase [Fibrobacterota bacterium]|nr:class I SAM-dependent methyltransferase [Fibrobacterota bacterium]QQS06465.1 MAG: class I SAM-dependent methyltransferase [Fibrobacterota bacterium]